MMDRMQKTGRLLALSLLGLLIMASGCNGTTEVTMEVPHDCVGSWMPLNSDFNHPTGPGEHKTWFGFVMQLGHFQGNGWEFGSIELWKGDTRVAEHKKGTFTWINLVGKDGGGGATYNPMTKAQVDWFLPIPVFNPNYKTVCADLEACQGKNFTCNPTQQGGHVFPECLRQRKLHRELTKVDAILTYWEGARGYSVKSKDNGKFNGFEFVFPERPKLFLDDVEQDVDFDKIKITEEPNGLITHGSRHDPIWPK